MKRTRREIWTEVQNAGLLSGPVFTSRGLLEDPHYAQRDYWQEVDHPVTGPLTCPGAPYRSGNMAWKIKRTAPLLAQHNEDIHCALGHGKEELARLKEGGVI